MKRVYRILLLLAVIVVAAPPLRAGERVIIELNDGARVEGELLKKDEKVVYLSIAEKVLAIDREKIKELTTAEGEKEKPRDVSQSKLYQAGKRTVKAVSAHAEELGPGIVVVKTPAGLGTGWFCNSDGYVITNKHVISNEQSITVTAFKREGNRFEKKVYKKVKLIALDGDIDLALLHIEEDLDMEVPQLYLGDSDDLKVGDKVFTIGNPMGLERSTGEGIISKTHRNYDGRLYIQTTAPIAPGNSGGPLFNERGEVIGVVNMGYITLDGLGFAIPSRYIKEFLDNVESFAFDPDNPNAGVKYMEPPITATDGSLKFTESDFIKVSRGISCLTLADINRDGVEEIVFVNNTKGEIGIIRRRRKDEIEQQVLDFEDINQLAESERFKLVTHAVNNKISSIAIMDRNNDTRPDIIFHGDIDGLSVLEQKKDGSFRSPQKIADVKISKRTDALRVADFNGDGEEEIFVLGPTEFSLFKKGVDRVSFPLNARYRDRISEFKIADVNRDKRLDLIFFCPDRFYAMHVVVQKPDGTFVEEEMVHSHLSGCITPYNPGGDGLRFLTLDKGQNRARELVLTSEKAAAQEGHINVSIQAIPLSAKGGAGRPCELMDLNGNGKLEVITVSEDRNEFLVLAAGKHGFRINRSPAPKKVSGFKLFKADDKAVLFSFSQEDKIFGVSRIDADGVTFPRPINIEGLVQFMWLGRIDEAEQVLLWVEKIDKRYIVQTTPAAALATKAFADEKGSIDIETRPLQFGKTEDALKAELRGKPERLAFGDFNADGQQDVILYWSYSGKESLYQGLGNGRFKAIIVEQKFLEEQKGQPLLLADIDDDGNDDVLYVQPGFVRVLKVDRKDKLYVERQFNWEFENVEQLTPYSTTGTPRFLARSGNQARIVEFNPEAGEFKLIATIDLAGLEAERLKVGDVDGSGSPDILAMGGNALQILYGKDERRILDSKIVFNARLDNFTYWKAHAADLDGDEKDEVLLFDSSKAMFEIYRPDKEGNLRPLCRHRLFEKTIYQRGETSSYEIPQELITGDVDGDKKADLIFILQDRVAIYLQAAPGA